MTESMKIFIWGREHSLPIVYDCYEGESVSQEQIDSLRVFIGHSDWIDKAKIRVEAYCRECVDEDDKNQKKDNIFSYIKPESIFIKRDKHHPRVALMCKYRYDPEHGLAVVFASDGGITVGSQDIIL